MSTTKQEQEALPLKIKKPSYKREEDKLYKVKLNEKPKENAIPKQETEKPVLSDNGEKKEERKENPVELQEVGSISNKEVKSPITEIKNIEKPKEIKEIKKPIEKPSEVVMPENIQKLVSFMKDTGGNIQDYARLNRDDFT